MSTVELAACQVHVRAEDYASPESFERLLDRTGARLDAARERLPNGAFAHPCLAVFPEMVGTFLLLQGRLGTVRRARTTSEAFALVGLSDVGGLIRAMWNQRFMSPKSALLASLAPQAWATYHRSFAQFARRHHAWVVAGSALLPRNLHGDLADRFAPADSAVFNTSLAFSPEGRPVGCARKVNLVPTLEDELGLAPGSAEELSTFQTPFGPVGTLICYDGFDEAHTRSEPAFCRLVPRLDRLGARVIAQPAANPWPWEQPWVFAEPGEHQLRSEQWLSEGLLAQLHRERPASIRYAVTAQLLGGVLETRFDGRSHILACDDAGARVVAEAARADADPQAEEVLLRAVEL